MLYGGIEGRNSVGSWGLAGRSEHFVESAGYQIVGEMRGHVFSSHQDDPQLHLSTTMVPTHHDE